MITLQLLIHIVCAVDIIERSAWKTQWNTHWLLFGLMWVRLVTNMEVLPWCRWQVTPWSILRTRLHSRAKSSSILFFFCSYRLRKIHWAGGFSVAVVFAWDFREIPYVDELPICADLLPCSMLKEWISDFVCKSGQEEGLVDSSLIAWCSCIVLIDELDEAPTDACLAWGE